MRLLLLQIVVTCQQSSPSFQRQHLLDQWSQSDLPAKHWLVLRGQKRPEKHFFLVSRFWITWLRSGLGPPILKVLPFWIFSMKSVGHKVSNELWGGMLASMLSDRQPLEFFLESIAKKCKNGHFFAFSQYKWDFATASYIQGTTMWKLTFWRFQKCVMSWWQWQ